MSVTSRRNANSVRREVDRSHAGWDLLGLGCAISALGYSVFSLSPLIIMNNALFAPKKVDIGSK